jgi:DNA-binding CsgD family transcriptional regulator/tetratricopeptide (TPR) repeat protein
VLVGRSGLSPVMVGRAVELDRLVALLGARSTPTVALVAGEAGIGKTRLAQELVKRAPADTLVLAGQADPGTVGRPLEVLLDALDGHTAESDPELLEAVHDAARPAEERVRAGVDLVRGLTADTTGLVVFEDLHWADSESVTAFERLAEPAGGRLLLVGTYRPDGLSRRHPASDALPRLDRRHSVTHIHLDRLGPADVSSFLTAVYDEDPSFRVVDALHGRTGGNPFFLEELVATSASGPLHDLDSMPLPWTVAELVSSQVDALDPAVCDMLTAASVLGRRVSFDVLAAVTGASENDLISRLHAAVESGLLVEADPDVFSFHHELAREAVEGKLLGRERRRLHEAAFDALRKGESRDHVALAHHARGAGRYDDMVDEARLGAHESLALGSTYQALELAETGLNEAGDDLDLLSAAARAAWLAGLLHDADDHAARWLRLAREAADASEEAAALGLRLRVAYDLGDLDAMTECADALVVIVDLLPADEERARAMTAIAQSYTLRDQIEAACEWADKALALADTHGLVEVRREAMVEKGSALMLHPERFREAAGLLKVAAHEAEAASDHVLAARALNNLVWLARRWRDLDEVRALIDRMRVQAEAAGFDSLAITAQTELMAQLATTEGDLDSAIAYLEEAWRPDVSHTPWMRARRWTAVFRAGLALEVGELDAAAQLIEDAKPVTARTVVGVTGLEFHLACRRGELERARALLADLIVAMDEEGGAGCSHAHDLLSAGLRAGLEPDEMRPVVERVGLYAGHRLDPDHPWRRLLDAQLAEAEGRIEAAAELYASAAGELGSAPGVLAGQRGTAYVGAAACLVQLGRLAEARVHAEAAAPFLARWRGWRVDQLRAVERRLGLGPEPSGPDALTPREREVVRLLAEGLTNTQLAERLFISPRTAAVHVSNILAKLGMSSRTEVAAWAVRSELANG